MKNKDKVIKILKEYENIGRSKNLSILEFTECLDQVSEKYFPETTEATTTEKVSQEKAGEND